MEKVGRVTSSFKDTVEVQMRSTASKEAREYGIEDACVIVDGDVKLKADFDEKQLEDAINQKISKL